MESTVSATDLARNLGDVLARVRYRGETFVVERNGRAVARMVPIEERPPATLQDLAAAWLSGAPDEDYADLLEEVGAADQPAGNAWDS